MNVVLLPGFGGSAAQPILVALERALPTHAVHRLAPPRQKLTPELTGWVDWLEAETRPLRPLVVIGRSFGGRLAVRLAARRALAGVVLLGFPVRPPGKRRPLDEAALTALRCPTLIVQGTRDELGPLPVLEALRRKNRRLEVLKLEGVGHSFGRRTREAIDATVEWISRL